MKHSLSNIADAYKIMFNSQQSYLLDISTALFKSIDEKEDRTVISDLYEQLLTQLKTYFDTSDVLYSLSLHRRDPKLLYSNKELLSMFIKFKDQINTEQLDVLTNQVELIVKELELHLTEMNTIITKLNEKKEELTRNLKKENTFGIEIIDFQHEEIFTLNNEIIAIADKPDEIDTVNEMFKDLIHEFKLHFAFEEFFFLQFNYPDYLKHKEEHKQLLSQLILDQKKLENNTLTIPAKDYFIAIHDLTEEHIQNYDMGYNSFLKESGLMI